MSRLVKTLAITFSTLILLVITAAVLLIVFVNPNRFKPQLAEYVQAQTGRELKIDGNIQWAFFPHFGLKVHDIRLGNPSNFPNQPFADINKADVKLAILPLLKKHIVIDQLILNELQLRLIKNKAGEVNWQFMPKTVNTNQQPVSANQAAAAPLFFNIAKVEVINSGLDYLDQQANKHYAIKHLAFTSKNVGFNQSFPVNLKFQMFSEQPSVKADFNLQGKMSVNPVKQSYQFIGIELGIGLTGDTLPNKKVHIDMMADIAMTEQTLSVKPLKIVLDKQTTIAGEFAKNFKNQLVSFTFNIPELILPAGNSEQKTTQTSSAPAALLPLALLKQLNANGNLQIGKLTTDKLTVTDIKASINAANGIIQLAPLQASLYQGSYQAQISIDARTKVPSLATQQTLKHIQLGELLSALGKQNKFPLNGTGDISLQLTTLGNDKNSWINNLAGNAKFAVTKGIIENVDVEYQLQRIRNFINKEAQPKQQGPNQTSFDSLAGSLQINSGVAHNNDLLLTAKTAQVKGQGSIDLRNQTLNYRIQASGVSENLGQDAYKIQNYLGGSLPIVISGKWDNPKVEPDWSAISQAIAKALVKQQAKKYTDKLAEQVSKKLGDDAGKQLQQVLGGLL